MGEIKSKGLTYIPYNAHSEQEWIHTSMFEVYENIDEIKQADVIFLTVKAHGLEKALQEAESLLKTNPIIIIMMNGLGLKDIVAKYISSDQIIETIANYPSRLEGSIVTNTGGNSVVICDDTPLAHNTLGPLFAQSILDLKFDPNFKTWQWKKAFMNIGMNAIAGFTMLPVGGVLERKTLVRLIKVVLHEALLIAEQEGIIFKEDMIKFFLDVAGKDPTHKPSMLQDIERGKLTEIEFMNGYVLKQAKKFGIPTPTNEAIVTIMQICEKTEK